MPQNRVCFTVKYDYTEELVQRFCRVHLWYHKRQHPLLLQAPGIFLTVCLVWRIVHAGANETGGLTLSMMCAFDFILLWMGFVHPWVFRRTMQGDLRRYPPGTTTLRFLDDRVEASNRNTQGTYRYEQIKEAYLTRDCVYLYVGDQALLIPANALEEGEKEPFQNFLQEKIRGRLRVKKAL